MYALLQSTSTLQGPMIDLSLLDLTLAAGLILIAIGISHRQGIGLTRDLVIGAVRSVVQLVLVGYVLVYIFAIDRWYLVVPALLVMLAVAAWTAGGRQDHPTRKLYGILGLAMLVGSGLTLVYVGSQRVELRSGGSLSDVVPTLLKLMGLPIPPEMTGQPLIDPSVAVRASA